MIKNIRQKLVSIKNRNPYLYYLWTEYIRLKGLKSIKKYTDIEDINNRYYKKAGRFPNLEHPVLFSEKIQWLKLHYRHPEMPVVVDKFAVRGWLKKKGYASLLNEMYQAYSDVDEIDLDILPNKFVMKATHGSGWNLIVTDKRKIDWFIWKKIMKSWLKHNIFWAGREWVYKDVKPQIICEKFMTDKSGGLQDYKFHCFNGQPKFIQVNKGRGKKDHVQNFYDLKWQLQKFGKDLNPKLDEKIPPPYQLEKMIEIATDLSQEFPYVRVDFYEVDQKIIFGELTFFPNSGMPDFKPAEYDKVWGDLLILPAKNH